MSQSLYHFEGSIQVTEERGYTQGYLDFPFEVPAGSGGLRLRLQYDPLRVGRIANLITLGLFDPAGFRGNAHRHPPDREVILSAEQATEGFIPGPLPSGRWLAQLALQAIVADSRPCLYSLEIEILPEDGSGQAGRQAMPVQKPLARPAGWFRGELHSHTRHSDGALTPSELVAEARRLGLDFLAVTDHNTTSALGEAASALDGLLLIPGIELTTFSGHALALGVERWVDWRTGYGGWTMEDAARQTHDLGGLFILAHPNDIGSPDCTGCRWEYAGFDLDLADAYEIWNSFWFNESGGNPKNLVEWQEQRSGKRRLPATAGCDFHNYENWGDNLPFTYVFASSLSVPAVLEGVRQGRVVLSSGPWLGLQISNGPESEPAGIGETLVARQPQVHLEVHWESAPMGSQLVIRGLDGVLLARAVDGGGSIQEWVKIRAEDRLWVEMFSQAGALLALANPVFITSKPA